MGATSTFANSTACTDATFTFPCGQLPGTSPISITADPAVNITTASLFPGTSTAGQVTASFCNVTVTYTHPRKKDSISVSVGLPSLESWNGRMQALGGGGYSGSFGLLYTHQAVAKGFVSVDTDAGHVKGTGPSQSPSTWALIGAGVVNTALVEDWGSLSLHEMAVIGKAVTETYYGTGPKYSYFGGCSGGGRQALMISQRFPSDFDGIVATAPAINIENFLPAGFWAAQAAVTACDELDGLKDGIISLPELCTFDPQSVVGQSFNCSGTTRKFTSAGATVVDAAWTGPRSSTNVSLGWFGVNKDAAIASYYIPTQCDVSNTNCSVGTGGSLFGSWFNYFLAKDPNFDVASMTNEQCFSFLAHSQQEYDSLLAAANPNLTDFRNAGGKMIIWHGLADEAVPINGTKAYYKQVLDILPDAPSFARFFTAPGVGHCIAGAGAIPNGAFDQLMAWVENGTVPETLAAVSQTTGSHISNLCAWPLQQVYLGGDATDPSSYGCRADPAASPFYQ
ncbi:feruloyl esterase B precursor protein [Colletotrichum acutatum]